MDSKLSGLDPKLREAYERVMNGPSPAPSGTSVPPANPLTPPPVTPPITTQTPQPEAVPAAAPLSPPPPTPVPAASSFAFNSNYQTNQRTTTVKKAGGKVSSVLIILGLVVLLVAYTFVWIYLFKLKIPFLPF